MTTDEGVIANPVIEVTMDCMGPVSGCELLTFLGLAIVCITTFMYVKGD